MISPIFNLIIGLVGMILILTAFILEDLGKVHKGGLRYNLFNLIGALLLIIYAYFNNAPVFIILNVFWAVVAIYFLIRDK